jgi:hypothetical protein
MKILALLGTLSFVLAGALVGARLLLLARRTRQRPELLCGAALFFYSVFAQPLVVASRPIGAAYGQGARIAVLSIALLVNVGTVLGMFLFTRVVFRSRSRAALVATCLGTALAALAAVGVVWNVAHMPVGAPYPMSMKVCLSALSVAFGCAMAWASAESFHYYGLMRRRLAIGLADPVVANRFLLWGLGCGASATISLALVGVVVAGMNLATDPVPMLMIAASVTTCAVSWTLSFLPPPRYVRWISGRASSPGAAG